MEDARVKEIVVEMEEARSSLRHDQRISLSGSYTVALSGDTFRLPCERTASGFRSIFGGTALHLFWEARGKQLLIPKDALPDTVGGDEFKELGVSTQGDIRVPGMADFVARHGDLEGAVMISGCGSFLEVVGATAALSEAEINKSKIDRFIDLSNGGLSTKTVLVS